MTVKNFSVMLQGGLGNQLFIYFTLKSLASCYNGSAYFDTSYFSYDKYNREVGLKRLGLVDFKEKNRLYFSSKFLRKLIFLMRRITFLNRFFSFVCFERKYNQYTNFNFENFNDYILIGYFQHENYLDKDLVIKEFKNTDIYKHRFQSVLKHYDRNKVIAIHLRSYSEVKSNHEKNECIDYDYIKSSLKALSYDDKLDKLLVFTDNKIFAQEVLKNLNFDFYQDETPESTFLSLSCFNRIICSNSSFGWWGAYLSESNLVTYPSNKNYTYYPAPARGWLVID